MRRLMRFWRKNGDQSPRDSAYNVDYHDLEPGFGTGAEPMQAAADASAETAVDADWATEVPAVETEFTDARSSDAERAGAGLAEEDFAGSMADRAAAMPPPAPAPERSTQTALEQRRQRLSRVSRARRIGTVLSVAVPLTLLTLFIGGGGWAWYSGRLDIASIRGTEAAQVAGAERGAPARPHIWRKVGLTTVIAAVAFVALLGLLNSGLTLKDIPLPAAPGT